MLALLIASAAIVGAAAIAAAHLTPRGALATLLAFLLLVQALVLATLLLAGLVLRTLEPLVLALLSMTWLVLTFAVAARATRGSPPAAARWRRMGRRIAGALREPATALAAVLIVATLAWRAFLILRLPMVDYDGWSYHLVFADVWLQHDALVLVPQRPWTAGYPADAELLTTWLAAFTRTDALTGLGSLLSIPVAMVAAAGLARSLGAGRRWALLAALVLAMTPALVALAGTTYVDGASVAAVVATWWLGLRVVRGERDRSAAVLLGIAGGLALGTKGTNWVLVGPILLVAGLLWLRDLLVRREGSPGAGVLVARLALFATPVLVLGVAWYLKNVIVYGNPLYPFAIGPFAGPTTLTEFTFTPPALQGKGKLAQLAASWVADWNLTHYTYNVRPGGLGRAWPLVGVVAFGGLAIVASRRMLDALALVALPAAITLLTMPMPWYARLSLFLPGLALPLVAVALTWVRGRAPVVATAGGLVLVGVATISLVFANASPNIDIRAAFKDEKHWPGPRQYVTYLLSGAERRADVSLRNECAGWDAIPAGDRVVPAFNLLHGVAGPDFARILTDPIEQVSTPAELATAMRTDGARWLAAGVDSRLDQLAAADPAAFIARGDVCQGGRLWELAGSGA
jgi:dolichyl-phosphate-mannose-protein mannosyltransferase